MKKLMMLVMIGCAWASLAVAEDKAAGEKTSKTVKTKAGAEFALTLESNRTTGYQWELDKPLDESKVKLVRNEYKKPETAGVPGAGGKEVWTFKAVAEGKTTITMKYARSWEKDQEPAKRAKFKIVIGGEDEAGKAVKD
jgi:inhibitor of cysteine peptidase